MRITFKLYATLGHLLPEPGNVMHIDVDEGNSIVDILTRFQVPLEQAHLVLINGVYIQPEQRGNGALLKDGDALAIWPPVAGG